MVRSGKAAAAMATVESANALRKGTPPRVGVFNGPAHGRPPWTDRVGGSLRRAVHASRSAVGPSAVHCKIGRNFFPIPRRGPIRQASRARTPCMRRRPDCPAAIRCGLAVLVATCLATAGLLGTGMSVAQAHDELLDSIPAVGATLD